MSSVCVHFLLNCFNVHCARARALECQKMVNIVFPSATDKHRHTGTPTEASSPASLILYGYIMDATELVPHISLNNALERRVHENEKKTTKGIKPSHERTGCIDCDCIGHDARHLGSRFQHLRAEYRFCGGAANELFAHFKDINFVFAGAMCIVQCARLHITARHTHHNQHMHIAPQPQCRPNELQRTES